MVLRMKDLYIGKILEVGKTTGSYPDKSKTIIRVIEKKFIDDVIEIIIQTDDLDSYLLRIEPGQFQYISRLRNSYI